MGLFWATHGWGGDKETPAEKSVTHILEWWNLAQLYLTKRRFKKYEVMATSILQGFDKKSQFFEGYSWY